MIEYEAKRMSVCRIEKYFNDYYNAVNNLNDGGYDYVPVAWKCDACTYSTVGGEFAQEQETIFVLTDDPSILPPLDLPFHDGRQVNHFTKLELVPGDKLEGSTLSYGFDARQMDEEEEA